jgi:hypothetical protein
VIAAAVEPEEEGVVLAALAEDEERDTEPGEEVDPPPDETAVDPLDKADAPDPPVLVTEAELEAAAALALETEAELYNDSLLALLEALILLMTSATVLAAVPLAVRGVAEPARQVVTSRPILMPVRPSS